MTFKNKTYVETAYRFLQRLGYDASISDNFSYDIVVNSLGETIQVFEGGWDDSQNIYILLGFEHADGYRWRLLDSTFIVLVTPNRFHFVSSRSLLEFILANEFHKTHRVPPRKNKEAVLIKIRIPYLVWSIPDLRTFNRPDFDQEQELENSYFEFRQINDEEYEI